MNDLSNRGAMGQKVPMFKSARLRKFAKGQECTLLSEWCNGDWTTTVLCHSRPLTGTGTAQKPPDWWAYHGCSACHAAQEAGQIEFRELYLAIYRTQLRVYSHFGSLT